MPGYTEYSQEIADAICDGIASGKSLRALLQQPEMPASSSVFKWLSLHKDFAEQYARARETQADVIFDEILLIADEECLTTKMVRNGEEFEEEIVFDSVAVQRNKLRIDSRKWMAGKLRPKVYGEKTTTELMGSIEVVSKEQRDAAVLAATRADS